MWHIFLRNEKKNAALGKRNAAQIADAEKSKNAEKRGDWQAQI